MAETDSTGGVARFAAQILKGDHDAHLDTLAAAITKRLVDGHATERWLIDIPDGGLGDGRAAVRVTEDDLTMGEVAAVQFRTGKSWTSIDPRGDGADAMAVTVVRLISLGVEDAESCVGAVPVNTFVDWLGSYTVTPDPKGISGSGQTPTS